MTLQNYYERRYLSMKKKATLSISLLFMVLCFMFINFPATTTTTPDKPSSLAIPLSDMEDSDEAVEKAHR